MSEVLQIVLAVIRVLVYLFVGIFLSGLMGPDDDDPIMDVMFMLFWPVIILFAMVFSLVFGMANIAERPVSFVKRLGVKLADKIKSVFKKKDKDKTSKCYVEHDTRCDKCCRLQECLKDDVLLDVTKMNDSRKHYICAMGAECKKDAELYKAALKELGYSADYYPTSVEELREVYEKMEEMISNESNGISGCDEVNEDEKNIE